MCVSWSANVCRPIEMYDIWRTARFCTGAMVSYAATTVLVW